MGPFETMCQIIMDEYATQQSNPAFATAPFYQYGKKFYNASTGVPPQVRAQKLDGVLQNSTTNPGFGEQGNIATARQTIQFKCWGSDEEEAFNVFKNLLLAIDSNSMRYPDRSSIIEQPYTWLPTDGDIAYNGEAIEFEYDIPGDVPAEPVLLKVISGAYVATSASISGTFSTGSYPSGQPESEWVPLKSGSIF